MIQGIFTKEEAKEIGKENAVKTLNKMEDEGKAKKKVDNMATARLEEEQIPFISIA